MVVSLVVVVVTLVPLAGACVDERGRYQLHLALRAVAGVVADHFRMHGAGVAAGALGRLHVHLGDEAERLVRLRVQRGREPLALGQHVGDGARTTSSTNCSCSTWPLSPPTCFMRAPGSATLKVRVFAVFVK